MIDVHKFKMKCKLTVEGFVHIDIKVRAKNAYFLHLHIYIDVTKDYYHVENHQKMERYLFFFFPFQIEKNNGAD